MTVKELIKALRGCNKEAEVCLIIDFKELSLMYPDSSSVQLGVSSVEESDDWCELLLDKE